jgi:hypothetical protein
MSGGERHHNQYFSSNLKNYFLFIFYFHKIRKARDEGEAAVQKLKQHNEFEKYTAEELKKLKQEKKQVSLLHKVSLEIGKDRVFNI